MTLLPGGLLPGIGLLPGAGQVEVEVFTFVTATNRTTNGCTVTFNSASMDMTPTGMKQLQGFFDRLTMDTCGDETGNASATVIIEPLE